MSIQIIYEDEHIIAVNKPAGVISEINPFEVITMEGEVMNYLEKSKKKPFLGVIHRLDKVTSGVMLFAKKKSALVAFNKLFELKTIQKTYHALTNNLPPEKEGELVNHLYKNQLEKRATIVASATKESKLAKLHYTYLQDVKQAFLLELKPSTGRFHQIRAQLAHINCIILGDEKYGGKEPYEGAGIALHARSLSFKHPLLNLKKNLLIIAPYPEHGLWPE